MLKTLFNKITRAADAAIGAHLEWIFRMATSRPLSVIFLSLILLALSFVSISATRFESDLFKLFPAGQGPLRLFLDSLEWTGSIKDAYFILEGDKELLPGEAEAFAGRLKQLRVDGSPAFSRVVYRVYDPAEAKAFADFIAYAVIHPQLFLSPDGVGGYAEKLLPHAMEQSLRRVGTELASQAGMGLRDLVSADPLYLRDLILPRLKQGSQALDLDPDSPYFLSRDGQVLIIIAEPVRTVQDMAFARKLVAGINEARRGAGVNISCAGAHLSAVIDEAEVKGNVIACVISSLFIVLLLFYLTYRRFLPTLLIPLILLFGVVLALGAAGIFLTSISLISFAFTALIIGLGTDYSIHLYDRFYSERSAGHEPIAALREAITHTGHGVFTAATTTALPFLALTISEVRALSELGLLVGLGVIFSMYSTLFFLPPLLLFAESRFPSRGYRPLPRFALDRVWSFATQHSRLVGFLSLGSIALLFAAAFFVSFEGDLKNLQPRHSEAFQAQEKIEKHLGLSPKQMLVAVEGNDLEKVMSRGEKVEKLAEKYLQNREIRGFSSLGRVINDQGRQGELIESLAQRLGPLDPGGALRVALERSDFAPESFQPVMQGLSMLKNTGPVSAAEALARLGKSPLRGVVDRHLVKATGSYHLLFYLYYAGGEFPRQTFLRELAAADPTARATSADMVSDQLAGSVKKSFVWGFILGGTLVMFLLATHFKSLVGISCTMFPVIAGVIAMLGLMALTGMPLNFMNAMVLVTILGMGSDYGLHIAHRVIARPEGEQCGEFAQASRAILLSALTTIAGFGSLAFTDYGALASIGWATNFGVAATALFALVSLPALLFLLNRR